MKTHNFPVWLIGAGAMSIEYVKVLQALKIYFTVIGRGVVSAKKCKESTGCDIIIGGLEKYLSLNPCMPTHVIIAVGIDKLFETTMRLLEYGVPNILVEKPAGLNKDEIKTIFIKSKVSRSNVYVGYNRRFYASVLRAKEIIEDDGGVTSFNFEFTEWGHVIKNLNHSIKVKKNWFTCNSSHVVDLAFYLGGKPKRISAYTSGIIDWHPSASVFSGAGISENGSLFNYNANWDSPGRWGVEILTKNTRLILRPLEKLQIQKHGDINSEFVDCNYILDEKFKPGLFMQTKYFIENNNQGLCDICSHVFMMGKYAQIASY